MVECHGSADLSDVWERTALHVAVVKSSLYFVHCLIERKADVNIPIAG